MKNKIYFLGIILSIFLVTSCEKDEEFEPAQIQSVEETDAVESKSLYAPIWSVKTDSGAFIKYVGGTPNGILDAVKFEIGDFRYDFLYHVGPTHIRKLTVEGLQFDGTTKRETVDTSNFTQTVYKENGKTFLEIRHRDVEEAIWSTSLFAYRRINITIEVTDGQYWAFSSNIMRRWNDYVTRTFKNLPVR